MSKLENEFGNIPPEYINPDFYSTRKEKYEVLRITDKEAKAFVDQLNEKRTQEEMENEHTPVYTFFRNADETVSILCHYYDNYGSGDAYELIKDFNGNLYTNYLGGGFKIARDR